jgi:tripartite-type tricarboxylate transporter receptor subunit TctC
MKRIRGIFLSLLALYGPVGMAQQAYPSRTIKMIVPFPPGGGFDRIARPFAERLAVVLGVPVIVDNRSGAGGNIGTEAAARAEPDGYTVFMGNEFLGANPNLYKGLRYDPVRDFIPISHVGTSQMAIAANPALPVSNAKEMVVASQARPLQYGTPGVGTVPHLFTEMLGFSSGMKVAHIPYRGSAAATTDAMGGQIDFVVGPLPALVPHIKTGKLRGISVIGGNQRSSLMPDVPTLEEGGIKGVDHEVWYGLFVPTGTPPDVVKRIREATVQALEQPELIERLRLAGYEARPSTPEALTARLKGDLAKWKQVVERAQITVE